MGPPEMQGGNSYRSSTPAGSQRSAIWFSEPSGSKCACFNVCGETNLEGSASYPLPLSESEGDPVDELSLTEPRFHTESLDLTADTPLAPEFDKVGHSSQKNTSTMAIIQSLLAERKMSTMDPHFQSGAAEYLDYSMNLRATSSLRLEEPGAILPLSDTLTPGFPVHDYTSIYTLYDETEVKVALKKFTLDDMTFELLQKTSISQRSKNERLKTKLFIKTNREGHSLLRRMLRKRNFKIRSNYLYLSQPTRSVNPKPELRQLFSSIFRNIIYFNVNDMAFFTQQSFATSVQPHSIASDLAVVPSQALSDPKSAGASYGSRKRKYTSRFSEAELEADAAEQLSSKHDAEDSDDESQNSSKPSHGRQKVLIACHFCRSRKLKCDGDRPQCGNCSRRGRTECVYDSTVRRRGPGRKTIERKSTRQVRGKSIRAAEEPTVEIPLATRSATKARPLSIITEFRPSKKPRLLSPLSTPSEMSGRLAGDTSEGSSKGSATKLSPAGSQPPPTAASILAGGRASNGSENGRAYTPASETSSVDGDEDEEREDEIRCRTEPFFDGIFIKREDEEVDQLAGDDLFVGLEPRFTYDDQDDMSYYSSYATIGHEFINGEYLRDM